MGNSSSKDRVRVRNRIGGGGIDYSGEDGALTPFDVALSPAIPVALQTGGDRRDDVIPDGLMHEYFAVRRSVSVDLEHQLGIKVEEIIAASEAIGRLDPMFSFHPTEVLHSRKASSSGTSFGESTNFSSSPASPVHPGGSPARSALKSFTDDLFPKSGKKVRILDGHEVVGIQTFDKTPTAEG